MVQYDSKHQATTITLNGLEGKMVGNLLRITKANSPSNTHLVGDYYVLFNSQDLNQHTGFYRKEYIDDINKPCLEQHPTRTFNFKSLAIKCHPACVEAYLLDEFFKDPENYYVNKDGFKATKTSLTALQIDKFTKLIETLNAKLGDKMKGTVVAVTKENIDKMLKEAKDKGLTAGEHLLLNVNNGLTT